MKNNCCKNEKNKEELTKAIAFLKLLSEKNRLKIICILKKEDLCVCDILEYMDLSQNLVSHHLKVLKDFGLLESRKEGRKVIYSFNLTKSKEYIKLLSHFIA